MRDNLDDITLALAGMIQAIALIREFTHTGKLNEAAFTTSLYSLFQTNPIDVPSVYNGIDGLKLGLEKLFYTFDPSHPPDRLQSKYLLSFIHLQKKLSRSPATLSTLAQRIEQAQKQVDYFSLTHSNVMTNLSDIYLKTISTFKFRFVLLGTPRVLQARENMEKVRALLLAGVRSAVLWRQVGGSRLQLLFSRAKMKASAEKLLAEIEATQIAEKELL